MWRCIRLIASCRCAAPQVVHLCYSGERCAAFGIADITSTYRRFLVYAVLVAVAIDATLRWPDYILADLDIPVALIVVFVLWRRAHAGR